MKPIADYNDAEAVRQLMKNAKRVGQEAVYWEAFNRLCELEGKLLAQTSLGGGTRDVDQSDPLYRDFCATLAAYEELLTAKNGKTTKANRTRQKLRNKGLLQCLEDWALDAKPTTGFELLVRNGLVDLTGEHLVVKYASRFSDKAVAAARARLKQV